MDKININLVAVNYFRNGNETVLKWNSLEAFNKHVAAISKQKDWQMYFPMKAVIKFYDSDGTIQDSKLIIIARPYEITL